MSRILFFGLIATFVGTVVLTGNGQDAIGIFLCPFTAVVWIPAVFVSGAIIVSVIDSVGPKNRRNLETRERTKIVLLSQVARARTVASREAALKTYLEQADARGMDRDRAVSNLGRNGWSEVEIRDALGEMPQN